MFWKQSNKAVYRKSNSYEALKPNEFTYGRFLLQAWRCDEKTGWIEITIQSTRVTFCFTPKKVCDIVYEDYQ